MKWPLVYVKSFILFSLSFNTALAGEVFTTDFESGTLNVAQAQENGFFWRVGHNTTISSEKSKSGSYSLKLTFPAAAEGKDSFSEQGFALGGYYPDLWVKYDLYVPNNYYHRLGPGTDNNKGFMMTWAGTYSGTDREGPILGQHLWPTGNNGETNAAMWAGGRINGEITIDKNWLCAECGNGNSTQGIVDNDRGHWMTITIHAKYASKSNNDGVYEIWKTNWQGNTIKLIDIHDGAWYATKPNSTEPARGFDKGYLLGWSNSGFDKETIFHIDDITFSTTSLLNNNSTISNLASPKPPTIIVN